MGSALLQWSPVIGTAAVALIYGIFRLINRRGGEKARREPSWVELADENRKLREEVSALSDKFEAFMARQAKRDAAFRNILASASEQWPADHAGPTFDENDIAALSDTMPAKWRPRRIPRKKEATA